MRHDFSRFTLGLGWLLLSVYILTSCGEASKSQSFNPSQTSGAMLLHYAEMLRDNASPPEKESAEFKLVLVEDIYIKAHSYAILNKTFFWFSLIFALGVLIWPSLGVLFKDRLNQVEWVKSAIVQTTITGLAALMFTFYTQYKDKQTYAETLMRYVVYSRQDISDLANKVSEEIARIDHGFTFNAPLKSQKGSELDSTTEVGK